MLALLLSGLVLLFLCTSFGFAASKWLGLQAIVAEKLLIGMALVNTITAIFSLAFPVNAYVLGCLLVVSFLLIPLIKSDLQFLVSTLGYKRQQIIATILFIIPGFLMALNSAANNYDTALYHTQAIKWMEEYPVVPGLGNLHGRFGFNPNVFCLFALTSFTAIFKQHIYAVNFVAFGIMTMYFVSSLYNLYKKQGISGLFIFFAALFLMVLLLVHNLATPSPDFLALTIPLFIIARTAEWGDSDRPIAFTNVLIVLILAAYVVTVKLSSIPILLLPLLLLLRYKLHLRQLLLLIAIPALIVLPWLIRNIIISGWLVYPMPSLDVFNFDWEVPLSKVAGEHESVVGWARNPGPQYAAAAHAGIGEWFPLWLKQFGIYQKLFIAAGFILPVAALLIQAVKKRITGYVVNCIIITALAGYLFWLFTAPVFRFGIAFIGAGLLSPLLTGKFIVKQPKPVLIFNMFIVMLFCLEVSEVKGFIKNSVYKLSSVLIKPLSVPEPAEDTFRTFKISGTTVYKPIPGDQCFGHMLPCTPYPDSTVILRGENIREGFKVKPLKGD